MKRLSRPRLRINPLHLQVAGVLAGGVVVIGIALYTSLVIERGSRRATSETRAALLASEITADIDSMTLALVFGSIGEQGDAPRRPFETLSLGDAIQAHDAVGRAQVKAHELHGLIGSQETLQIHGAADEAIRALDTYIKAPSQQAFFTDVIPQLGGLRFLAADESPRLHANAERDQATLLQATATARLATIIAALASAMCVATATVIIGRRLRATLDQAERETVLLTEASTVMQRRNEQFGALYQVVSEVTETLSMKYVVNTTIREARKLVDADLVGLRRIEGNMLVLAGSEGDVEGDVAGLGRAIPLGTGIAGRAAKRGKTMRVDASAQASLAEGEAIPGMQSGIVVPLIVGARVVGTLSCWSRKPNHFGVDDERILEMMVSQVASAVTSADQHEQTELEAHSDALTTLPNRRQLNDDLRGVLLEATLAETPLAVTMVDIDHFKRFNDDYGHHVGDVTLQRVADVLKASIRGQDRVYRFGGEEFLIVFFGVGADDAAKLAERARAAVERTPMTGETMEPIGPVTISVGVALFPEHGRDMEALIDVADLAMYKSKERGRNCVTLASSELERLALAA